MNKYNLHLAGGALLATTALVSGSVAVQAAATLKSTVQAATLFNALVAAPLATQVFSATAATASGATIGPQSVTVDSTATIFEKSVIILSVAGAEFSNTPVPTVSLWEQSNGGATITGTGTASAATVTVFADRIRISDITARTYSAVEVSGFSYRNAQALATAGTSIALSGTIFNAAETATLESITSANAVTSKSFSTVEVTPGSAITISNTAAPQFAAINQAAGGAGTVGPAAATANVLSALLSRVVLSSVLAVGTNLTTTLSAGTSVSTMEIKLTHNVLTDPAVKSVSLDSSAGGVITNVTSADKFSAGSVTFSPAGATYATSGPMIMVVQFNGTTPISNWAAGTVATTHTAGTGTLVALAGGSGTAVGLNRGGLSTQLNFVQPSSNPFQSFIRVTNTGAQSGSVTVALRSSSSGAALGGSNVFTSAPIASGGTIQIAVSDIENALGVTPVLGSPYDATIAGPISGYVQHIGFKADSGVVTDLSAFRNGVTNVSP
jgi:hypothetical protein